MKHSTTPRALGWALTLSLGSTFSGTAIAQDASDETMQDDGPPPFLAIENGAAQPKPEFKGRRNWIQEVLWVETSFDSDGDGRMDRVYVDVTRPKATEEYGIEVAAIYETSPYYWGINPDPEIFWNVEHEIGDDPPTRKVAGEVKRRPMQDGERITLNATSHITAFVPRGFAVVHSASPGTGYSQGCPTIGGENESLAPKAVIDWLNGRAKGYTAPEGGEEVVADWCTGKVGMIGTSYNGTLPIAAATTGVEGLETIVPIAPNTSYYHYYRSNGLVRHPGGYMGEDIDVLYDFVNSGAPTRRAWCNENVRDRVLLDNLDRLSGDYSEWWAARDYANQLDEFKASVLMAHGFNDWNVMPEHSFRVREELKKRGVPTICYYHQGGHGGQPPQDLLMRWFTRYLYGVENGVEDGPKAYIVREGADRMAPTEYADYPNPEAEPVRLYFDGDGSKIGRLVADVEDDGEVSQQTLVDDVTVTGARMASEAESRHRLLFATATLMSPIHLSGRAKIKLRVAADAPAANLSVWVVSLPWVDRASMNSNENIITRGWADPQNSRGMDESAPLVPGEFVELTFDLQPDDQVIPPGERIGVMVFSSDADFTLKPKPGTELTLDLAASWIEFPIVGGASALSSATDF